MIEEETLRVYEQYRAEPADARREAARLGQAAAEEGVSLLCCGLRQEGRQERDTIVAAAKARLEANQVIAEAELREAAFDLAVELAGRITGEALDYLPGIRSIADGFFAALDEPESRTSRTGGAPSRAPTAPAKRSTCSLPQQGPRPRRRAPDTA